MAIDAGGGKRLAVYIPKNKARKVPTRAPVTDVQSSGGDYGTRKAAAFKKTPTYKRTLKAAKQANTRQLQARHTHTGKPVRIIGQPRVQAAGLGGALDSVAGNFSHAVNTVTPLVAKVVRPGAAMLSMGLTELPVGRQVFKAATNAAKDTVNLPIQTIPSLYHLGDEAKHGHAGEVARMLAQPYVDVAKHPVKSFSEHPVYSALLFTGVKGGIGRGIGRVVKPGEVVRSVPETGLREVARESPDVFRRGRQGLQRKHQAEKAAKLRARADVVEPTSVDRAAELRDKAARVDPARMTSKQVRRRVDERVALNEDVRRANRTKVTVEARKIVQPAGRGGTALSLVTQNITHATKDDLRAYMRELVGQHDSLGKAGQHANVKLRQEIDKLLADPKYDPGVVEVAARKYAEFTRPLQGALTDAGMLDKAQAERAALMPYAVRRMGAQHGKPEVTADVKAASKELRGAISERAKVERQRVTQSALAGRAQGRAEVLSAQADRRAASGARGPVTKARATATAGRIPKRSLAKLEKERGKLLEVEAVKVRNARQAVKDAEANVKVVRGEAKQQRRLPPQLLDAEGRQLSNEAIRAHMREHNVSEPAFLTQAPNARGAKNFYIASDKAPSINSARRTGEATRKGTFDAHPDTLVEGAARAQGLKDASDGFRGFVSEFAHRDQKKVRTFANKKEADQAARDIAAGGGSSKFVAVRVNPWGGRHEQLKSLLEDVNADTQVSHKELLSAINDALDGKDGKGPWALLPREAVDQMRHHMRILGAGGGGKVVQLVNSAFRKTVLSTSPRWLAGNTIEAGLRSTVEHAGPRSYITAKRVFARQAELDPKAALDTQMRAVQGGHYSMADRQHVHRDASQFEGTSLEGTAKALGAFWRAPGPKNVAQLWHGWTQFVFHDVNSRVERQFQTALAGKHIRTALMDGQTLKMGEKAVDQAARGLKGTEEQVALGRAVDRMYGKYSKFGPSERRAIALYTPFVAWTLNAVKFCYWTLPRDHPVLTSLIVSAQLATEEWRKAEGLDKFAPGSVPNFLQGSIPTKGGGHLRVSRYTPFGAFTSLPETFAGAVLPQYEGTLAALNGKDWKGKDLRGKNGQPADDLQRTKEAAMAFFGSTIPVFGQAQRIVTGKGPLGGRLRSEYDPFKAVAPKAAKTRKARSTSAPFGGGSSGGGGWGTSGTSSGGWG